MKETLLRQLIKDEALRLEPYKCPAGKLTIGIGRNLEDRGITEEEAIFLCRNDIDIVIAELSKNLSWYPKANKTVKIVLANMCFNMGISRLLRFKKTLAYLEQKSYAMASLEMLDSKWAKQVGNRAHRLSQMIKDLAV